MIEVDYECAEELHELHKNFQLCPEHQVPPNSKQCELMTTFSEKYVIYYRNSKQYLRLGMRWTGVHRSLKYKQSTWLKPHIDFNTEKKKELKAYSKKKFKLLNSAISGECIENVRKQKDVKMVTKWDGRYGAKKYDEKSNFHSCTTFGDDIAIIEMKCLNKPVYVRFSILDIPKTYVYRFHYDFMKSITTTKLSSCTIIQIV